MIPHVAMTPHPAFALNDPAATLAREARRIARRRSVAEGVARRGRSNDRNLPAAASAQITERARRRASRLGVVLHRAIESLWSAGEFDEALAIFREHKADRDRRAAGPVHAN